jgi:Fic family protein
MKEQLQILPTDLLETYLKQVTTTLQEHFEALVDAEISTDTFSFYTSVSSVFSSKIEGLYNAYTFAKTNELNQKNISEAHKLLSKHILAANWQGKYRQNNMYVSTSDGRIEYVAASPFEVETEMSKIYSDIEFLIKTQLSIEEVFFFASLIHLVFVKIHPWNDGNGRTARLLEKWFLSQKLGPKAWFIQSEKMYYNQHNTYYKNIRHLGLEYPELDYKQALPFLLMLPSSL